MWINGLTAKAAEWKGKSGVRTAVTLSGAGPVATATAEPEPEVWQDFVGAFLAEPAAPAEVRNFDSK